MNETFIHCSQFYAATPNRFQSQIGVVRSLDAALVLLRQSAVFHQTSMHDISAEAGNQRRG